MLKLTYIDTPRFKEPAFDRLHTCYHTHRAGLWFIPANDSAVAV
jgi:hypothetical protein